MRYILMIFLSLAGLVLDPSDNPVFSCRAIRKGLTGKSVERGIKVVSCNMGREPNVPAHNHGYRSLRRDEFPNRIVIGLRNLNTENIPQPEPSKIEACHSYLSRCSKCHDGPIKEMPISKIAFLETNLSFLTVSPEGYLAAVVRCFRSFFLREKSYTFTIVTCQSDMSLVSCRCSVDPDRPDRYLARTWRPRTTNPKSTERSFVSARIEALHERNQCANPPRSIDCGKVKRRQRYGRNIVGLHTVEKPQTFEL